MYIKNELEFDQLILEFYRDNEPSSGWIHCSYSTNSNRNQSLRAMREDGKVVIQTMARIGQLTSQIVTGNCPECRSETLLVSFEPHLYRCVNCGYDLRTESKWCN